MKTKLLAMGLFVLCLSGCLSTKVITDVPYTSNHLNKVVLLPVMIERIWQPTIPLIDASAFNGKTNKIADQITDYHEEMVFDLESSVADQAASLLGMEVQKYADVDEMTREKLGDYHNKNALYSDHNKFPKTVSSYPKFNPFAIKDGKLEKFFKVDQNYQLVGRKVCSELGVDGVLVSFSRLYITGVTMFGGRGDARLETYLMLVDKNGMVRGKTKGFTKPVRIKGKELQDYKDAWQQHPEIIRLTLNDLKNPAKKK